MINKKQLAYESYQNGKEVNSNPFYTYRKTGPTEEKTLFEKIFERKNGNGGKFISNHVKNTIIKEIRNASPTTGSDNFNGEYNERFGTLEVYGDVQGRAFRATVQAIVKFMNRYSETIQLTQVENDPINKNKVIIHLTGMEYMLSALKKILLSPHLVLISKTDDPANKLGEHILIYHVQEPELRNKIEALKPGFLFINKVESIEDHTEIRPGSGGLIYGTAP